MSARLSSSQKVLTGQKSPLDSSITYVEDLSINDRYLDSSRRPQMRSLSTSVKFSQILRPSDSAKETFIMTISDDSSTFDIGPNVSQHNRAEFEQLLSTYTPKKTETVNIALDIAFTDDEPIFYKPRRLPFAEQDIVDDKLMNGLKIELFSRVHPLTLVKSGS
ncbi:uncharacterized protein K02A2.6-like [Trichonephila clavipes]|nr:uncharacterized protein K02A2.6-like [Trichonephila clavipes]